MKKQLLIALFPLLLTGCSKSPGEKLIHDFFYQSLNDFESYKPVEFGPLDSVITDISSIKGYADKKIRLDTAIERYELYTKEFKAKKATMTNDDAEMYPVLIRNNKKIIDSISPVIDSLNKSFKPTFLGWKMKHSYRAKNKNGAYQLYSNLFFFDKDLKKILNVTEQ